MQISYTLTQNLSLSLFIIMSGIMAGFFWTYTFSVNPAMLQVSGEYYATVQSLFNVHVRNPMFFTFFFGTGAVGVVVCLLNLPHRGHWSFWLIIAATLVYILGVIVYTRQVNLPLNYDTESWDPKNLPAHWEAVRSQWNSANAIRVITSGAAFVFGVLALFSRSVNQA